MKFITSEWLKSADDDINTIKAIIRDLFLEDLLASTSSEYLKSIKINVTILMRARRVSIVNISPYSRKYSPLIDQN